MDPIALGLLKQSGAKSIQVKRPIVIGVLSTGNELVKGYQEDRTSSLNHNEGCKSNIGCRNTAHKQYIMLAREIRLTWKDVGLVFKMHPSCLLCVVRLGGWVWCVVESGL